MFRDCREGKGGLNSGLGREGFRRCPLVLFRLSFDGGEVHLSEAWRFRGQMRIGPTDAGSTSIAFRRTSDIESSISAVGAKRTGSIVVCCDRQEKCDLQTITAEANVHDHGPRVIRGRDNARCGEWTSRKVGVSLVLLD